MNRRGFLASCVSLVVSPAAARTAADTRLKITDVRSVPLRVARQVGTLEPAWNPGGRSAYTIGGGSFTEVRTDQGLAGIGPAIAPEVAAAARAVLAGKDPLDLEENMARVRTYARGRGYGGCAGVDIALWDLLGKVCGQPLYRIWGGRRKVTPYASMIVLSTPEERARMAVQLAEEGWKAIKLRLHHASLKEDIHTVEEVRKAVGDRMMIMTDANQAQAENKWQPGVLWDFDRALSTARQLERLGCYWLEEPLPRYAFDQLAELCRKSRIAIAGGENNQAVEDFRTMAVKDAYDILQPEVLVLGGITPVRKVAAMAEVFGKRMVPHNGGRLIGNIAHMHLVASCPNAPFLEILHDPPIGDYRHGWAILKDPPLVGSDGLLSLPDGPGLGIEIDPGLIALS